MTEKKTYIATVGLDFDGLKGKPRVEPGDPIPGGVKQDVIDDLLANGDIKESEQQRTSATISD